jgi:TetR/AcrR family transcriptional regulator
MTSANPQSKKAQTRAENTRKIISAAEKVFAEKGFSGGTTQEIADEAKLPKANVHYYFPTKEKLYARVLEDILEEWKADAAIFDTSDDPETVLRAYIRRKIEHSFTRPYASKVWAMEIIGRGKVFDEQLKQSFLEWNRKKVLQLRKWIKAGKLAPLDPQHLMFAIWATTQHYADFEHQIRAVNDGKALSREQTEAAVESVIQLFLKGLMPRNSSQE